MFEDDSDDYNMSNTESQIENAPLIDSLKYKTGSSVANTVTVALGFMIAILTVLFIAVIVFTVIFLLKPRISSMVLLISIDGFRSDYLEQFKDYDLKNLNAFIENGTSVEFLLPVYPSMTYPNHMSIATGLYAENHGILNNRMYDPVFNATYYYNTPEEFNSRWYDGEPIWVTAERQRVISAIHAWAGSHVSIKGILPTYRWPYSTRPDKENVDWLLSLFEGEVPKARLYTLYFEDVDNYGHTYGPDSEEVGKALKEVDDMIGYLMDTLAKRNFLQYLDIIILSDHGMASVSEDKVIYLDDFIPDLLDIAYILDRGNETAYGTSVSITPKNPKDIQPLYEELKNIEEEFDVYLKKDIPEHFHIKNHRRCPEILVLARPGWLLSLKAFNVDLDMRGAHGWDATVDPLMRGVLFANGPSFKKGYKSGSISNVEIYNLVCHILKINPSPNNGTFANVQHLLQQNVTVSK